MSLLIIATDPEADESSIARTVWRRNGVGKPSTVRFMWLKSLPRTLNSLRRSSPVATPGSTCTARSGSSASTPRRFWMSALPSVCWLTTAGTPGRNRSDDTVTLSV